MNRYNFVIYEHHHTNPKTTLYNMDVINDAHGQIESFRNSHYCQIDLEPRGQGLPIGDPNRDKIGDSVRVRDLIDDNAMRSLRNLIHKGHDKNSLIPNFDVEMNRQEVLTRANQRRDRYTGRLLDPFTISTIHNLKTRIPKELYACRRLGPSFYTNIIGIRERADGRGYIFNDATRLHGRKAKYMKIATHTGANYTTVIPDWFFNGSHGTVMNDTGYSDPPLVDIPGSRIFQINTVKDARGFDIQLNGVIANDANFLSLTDFEGSDHCSENEGLHELTLLDNYVLV